MLPVFSEKCENLIKNIRKNLKCLVCIIFIEIILLSYLSPKFSYSDMPIGAVPEQIEKNINFSFLKTL